MDSKKHRRRKRKQSRISFPVILVLFLLLMLIPLAFWLAGLRHVENTVPEYATGHVVEVSGSSVAGE